MADLLSLAATGASGGLLGGLFGIAGQIGNRAMGVWEAREKRKDQVLAYAQEEKRWAQEAVLLRLQREARAEETEQELAIAAANGSWAGLNASIAAEAAGPPSYKWVGAVRTLVRPVLTLSFMLLTAAIYFTLRGDDPGDAAVKARLVEDVVFVTTAAALWWFGERAQNPRGKK